MQPETQGIAALWLACADLICVPPILIEHVSRGSAGDGGQRDKGSRQPWVHVRPQISEVAVTLAFRTGELDRCFKLLCWHFFVSQKAAVPKNDSIPVN
jgi:hypothetical protein